MTKRNDNDYIQAIVTKLRDVPLKGRIEAAEALCKAPSAEAFEALAEALGSRDCTLACTAADAFVALRDRRAIKLLNDAYQASLVTDGTIRLEDGSVICGGRNHIADRLTTSLSLAFVRMHSDSVLCEMLTDPDWGRRTHAAWVLGERYCKQAVSPLAHMASNDPNELSRAYAAWVLEKINGNETGIMFAPLLTGRVFVVQDNGERIYY